MRAKSKTCRGLKRARAPPPHPVTTHTSFTPPPPPPTPNTHKSYTGRAQAAAPDPAEALYTLTLGKIITGGIRGGVAEAADALAAARNVLIRPTRAGHAHGSVGACVRERKWVHAWVGV